MAYQKFNLYEGDLGLQSSRTAKEPTKPKQKIIHKLVELHFFWQIVCLLKSIKLD